MKCLSCDRILSDFEATRKYPSNEYIDLCNSCFKTIKQDIEYSERMDLMDVEAELEFDDDYPYEEEEDETV